MQILKKYNTTKNNRKIKNLIYGHIPNNFVDETNLNSKINSRNVEKVTKLPLHLVLFPKPWILIHRIKALELKPGP